jgi:hypothetical protein
MFFFAENNTVVHCRASVNPARISRSLVALLVTASL